MLKSAWKYFSPFDSSFRDEVSRKMSLLVRSGTLALFFNTLTGDDNYSSHYRENVAQPIQLQLSKKPKAFSPNLIACPKFT